MGWNDKPIGVGLNESHAGISIPKGGCDFIVSSMGTPEAPSVQFAEHVGAAAAAEIPILGVLPLQYPYCYDWPLNDFSRWCKPEQDPHYDLLRRQFFLGGDPKGVKRTIHGLILNMTAVKDPGAATIANNWRIVKVASRVLDFCGLLKLGVPVWVFMTWAAYNQVNDEGEGPPLAVFLKNQCEGTTLRFAYPNSMAAAQQWGALPKPWDSFELGAVGYVYWDVTKFFMASAGKVTLSGVEKPVELWVANTTLAGMQNELNFTPTTDTGAGGGTDDPTGDPTGDDGNDGGSGGVISGDFSALATAINRLAAAEERKAAVMEKWAGK